VQKLIFATRSQSNQSSKHLSPFVKVVEGTSHYNFRIWRKCRPSQNFGEEDSQLCVDWTVVPQTALWSAHLRVTPHASVHMTTHRPTGSRCPGPPPTHASRGRAGRGHTRPESFEARIAACCSSHAHAHAGPHRDGPYSRHATCRAASRAHAEPPLLKSWPRGKLLTVKFRQPSHEFTFGVGMTFVSYPLVLTLVV
jgi:hypothetical protein